MMNFSYKIFRQGGDVLLAISDASILGKTFEEGELSMTVSKSFYSDKRCDEKEAIKLIEAATIVNAVGARIIELMTKKKLIDGEMVLTVSGVPHAQLIRMR